MGSINPPIPTHRASTTNNTPNIYKHLKQVVLKLSLGFSSSIEQNLQHVENNVTGKAIALNEIFVGVKYRSQST